MPGLEVFARGGTVEFNVERKKRKIKNNKTIQKNPTKIILHP